MNSNLDCHFCRIYDNVFANSISDGGCARAAPQLSDTDMGSKAPKKVGVGAPCHAFVSRALRAKFFNPDSSINIKFIVWLILVSF